MVDVVVSTKTYEDLMEVFLQAFSNITNTVEALKANVNIQ